MLHLLGFDHEISDKAEAEMEKEEEHLLKSLGWKGKGLIQSAYDAETNGSPPLNYPDGMVNCKLNSFFFSFGNFRLWWIQAWLIPYWPL